MWDSFRARAAAIALLIAVSGCATIPVSGTFRGSVDADARVAARVEGSGSVEIKIPLASDPGPMIATPVRAGQGGGRVGLIDVDGLLLNQNLTGLYSVGENPVASFREKLEAAAKEPQVTAIVVRIHSPGGGVTACDILAEELRRFRSETGKPVVCCLMDLATSGAYYLALGGDRIVAHPTTITGGVGSLINHYNLADAMAQLNLVADPIKSGPLVDLGSVTAPLDDASRELLQEMADSFRDRFRGRLHDRRKAMTAADFTAIGDGRVVSAQKALSLKMVDQIGYVHDAIAEAERLAGVSHTEVVLFQRAGYPARSLYAITPNAPIQGDILPFSYPGLDRTKIPTFLYLWQPDPTILHQGGR